MSLDQFTNLMGLMLLFNCIFFSVGLLKITLFRKVTVASLGLMFGEHADRIQASLPQVMFIYWILIIMFNLTPYLALRMM